LNGIDLDGSRRRHEERSRADWSLRLFYSYSHKDETLRNELESHLKILERRDLIAPWHDRMIRASEDWAGEIDENLNRADLILLLVSADFIASNYCYEKEMKLALERHEAGQATVIPIIVRNANWEKAPFSRLQVLPRNGKAVTSWPNKDDAWMDVSQGLELTITARRKPR
jgi:internalin A